MIVHSVSRYQNCYQSCIRCPEEFSCIAPGQLNISDTDNCLTTCKHCDVDQFTCNSKLLSINVSQQVPASLKNETRYRSLLITHIPKVIFEDVDCLEKYSHILVCQKYVTRSLKETTASLQSLCGIGQFQCHDGSCTLDIFKCDGLSNCADNRDEVMRPLCFAYKLIIMTVCLHHTCLLIQILSVYHHS